MINFLLGPPGGGKSYEAVVYHILPALQADRLVITNLPLNLEHIKAVNPDYLHLIEIRTETLKNKPENTQRENLLYKRPTYNQNSTYFNNSAFSHVEDYSHPWRHPVTGAGPLYVIDECHIPLPLNGTELEVEHWYSLHRHESADVLLLTQSYGKINRAIRDLVQVCYRVKKNTSFGSEKTYIRKVQDGLRGEVVNTSIRKYEKQYFPFYQSHTLGGGAELAAQDIVPIWRRWPFIGSAMMFILFFIILIFGDLKNPMNMKNYQKPTSETTTSDPIPSNEKLQTEIKIINTSQTSINEPIKKDEPYSSYGIHIVGHISSAKKNLWILALSYNGQKLKNVYSNEFINLGYGFQPIGDCSAWLTYFGSKRFITCDTPKQTLTSSNKIIN